MGCDPVNTLSFGLADQAGGESEQETAQHYAEKSEAQRQAAIKTGMEGINKSFAGFDENFYNKRADAFLKYALPQLSTQYQNVSQQVGFGLQNKGLAHSSQADKQWSDLYRQTDQTKQALADQAISQKQSLRNQVEASRQNLVSDLYTTADPSQSAISTANTIASLQAPSPFPILGNLFTGLLNEYSTRQLLNAYRTPTAPTVVQQDDYSFADTPVTQSSYKY